MVVGPTLMPSRWHNGIAPPQGLQLSIFRSMRKVSIPSLANWSAALAPAGPPPTTATLSLRPSGKVTPAQTTTLDEAQAKLDFAKKPRVGTYQYLEDHEGTRGNKMEQMETIKSLDRQGHFGTAQRPCHLLLLAMQALCQTMSGSAAAACRGGRDGGGSQAHRCHACGCLRRHRRRSCASACNRRDLDRCSPDGRSHRHRHDTGHGQRDKNKQKWSNGFQPESAAHASSHENTAKYSKRMRHAFLNPVYCLRLTPMQSASKSKLWQLTCSF